MNGLTGVYGFNAQFAHVELHRTPAKCFINRIVNRCECYLPYFLAKYKCGMVDTKTNRFATLKNLAEHIVNS